MQFILFARNKKKKIRNKNAEKCRKTQKNGEKAENGEKRRKTYSTGRRLRTEWAMANGHTCNYMWATG